MTGLPRPNVQATCHGCRHLDYDALSREYVCKTYGVRTPREQDPVPVRLHTTNQTRQPIAMCKETP